MELIEQVLDLNRIEAGKLSMNFAEVQAGPIIDDSLQLIQVQAREQAIVVRNETDAAKLPTLWTDSTRLMQSLVNLLSNAVKYNRKNGSITLRCETLDDGMLRIFVIDTGIGIASERHQDIYTPFERLGNENSSRAGTGIGLTITRQMIEMMGGRIGFFSEANIGSTFWLDIPSSRNPG